MNRFTSIHLMIIFYVFLTMILSVITGTLLIYILCYLGVYRAFQTIHLPFFLNVAIVSIIIGTIVSGILSRSLFKPLNDVIQGTKKVAKGDFSYRIQKRNDKECEINQLIDSFNYMSEELSSIEMFRQDFINNFSHEFKTPISSIIGYAKELKHTDLSQEERDEYLSIIISESERLSTLSSNILLLSRVENQKILSNLTTFSLDEQIRNCILMLQRNWENKNIEWELDLEEVTYTGDKDLLDQAWINLFSNAIKFSNPNGTIDVSCKLKNDDETENINFQLLDQ